jgi:hypothetical protein
VLDEELRKSNAMEGAGDASGGPDAERANEDVVVQSTEKAP